MKMFMEEVGNYQLKLNQILVKIYMLKVSFGKEDTMIRMGM